MKVFQYIPHHEVRAYLDRGWTLTDDMSDSHHGHYSVIMQAPDSELDAYDALDRDINELQTALERIDLLNDLLTHAAIMIGVSGIICAGLFLSLLAIMVWG